MKIMIITGGNVDQDVVRDYMKDRSFEKIIAADRGLFAAHKMGLEVEHIVGDFDSVPLEVLEKYKSTSIPVDTYPQEKDWTDTELAIEMALSFHPESITIFGATGTRLDHTLANIHLLRKALDRNIEAEIVDQCNRVYLKKESFQIKKVEQYGDYISLLPFSNVVENITLKGFKYPLNNYRMLAGQSIGVSNEIVDDTAEILWEQGILIVFETKDK